MYISKMKDYCARLLCLALCFAGASAYGQADLSRESVAGVIGERFEVTDQRDAEAAHRPAIRLTSTIGSAYIDQETGLLTRFLRNSKQRAAPGDPEIGADVALNEARAFVGRVGIQLSEPWVLVQLKYLDRGSAGREYLLEWKKILHGVQLPAFVVVWVDAHSAVVMNYMLVDDPVLVPLATQITGDQAVGLIAARQGVRRYATEEKRPVIWYEGGYPGPQALFWQVTLRDLDAKPGEAGVHRSRVNAVTGRVQSISVSEDFGAEASGTDRHAEDVRVENRPTVDLQRAAKATIPPTVFESMIDRESTHDSKRQRLKGTSQGEAVGSGDSPNSIPALAAVATVGALVLLLVFWRRRLTSPSSPGA